MWPSRENEYRRITTELRLAAAPLGLQGIAAASRHETLGMQFIASLRREDYYRMVQVKPISARRADPNDPSFDAERAVAFHIQQGNVDEAGWLIFLMTHFARPQDTGWLRLQDVYGKLGTGIWNWSAVTANPTAFYQWLNLNWKSIRGSFGNHRKYESLRPTASRPMTNAVADYLDLIGQSGHVAFFAQAVRSAGNDPHKIFDHLYKTIEVRSFGRLAKFDYLALVGRYKLAPIEAGSAYLDGATGPRRGARLLVDGNADSSTPNAALQVKLDELDKRLGLGMEVMEDALCNWQKSPDNFVHYKG